MKTIELLGIGIRLLGIYVLILSFPYIDQSLSIMLAPEITSDYEISLMDKLIPGSMLAIYIVVGLFFLKFPVTIARLVFPRSNADYPSIDIGNLNIERTGFVLIGMYLLVSSLPNVIYNILMHQRFVEISGGLSSPLESDFFVNGVATIVEMVIGFVLLLSASSLVKLIDKARRFGE